MPSEQPALARQRLARIVGRDTQTLSDTEVHRALIETLAESACDGIVSPLLYLAIGGVPLAMAYKAVNTLDSMIGHTDKRYLYFGKAAARLDDVANYLPARITAFAIMLAAGMDRQTSCASSLRIWSRDRGKHKSPNAGQPESAMAGALQVRLGGENTYQGERIAAPMLGAEFEPPRTHHASASSSFGHSRIVSRCGNRHGDAKSEEIGSAQRPSIPLKNFAHDRKCDERSQAEDEWPIS